MTQALKLALDALENLKHKIRYENEQDEIGSSICCDELSFKPHSEDCKLINAITAINKALAQPEQEPVATDWSAVHKTLELVWFGEISADEGLDEIQDLIYTSSPQRTWVGLTDDEMEETFIECGGMWNGGFWTIEAADFHPFLITIEAKLKEKNA